MTTLHTEHLENTVRALESAIALYEQATSQEESTSQEVFRMAITKGFELAQEVTFKLLRRRLLDFGYSNGKLRETPIKDILRLAAHHGIMTVDEVERWFLYRDIRNETAHEYGMDFVEATIAVLRQFVEDAKKLIHRLRHSSEDGEHKPCSSAT